MGFLLTLSGQMFSPANIAGLTIWLDASRIVGLSDGNPVPTWLDASGLGNDASNGVGGQQPLYKTNIVNGKPVVRFDGIDDGLNFPVSTLTSLTAGEVFCVVKLVSDPPTGAKTGLWLFGTTATPHYPFTDSQIYDNFGSTTRQLAGDPTPSLALWTLYNITTSSSVWTARINGTQLFTTATNTVGFTTNPVLGHNGGGGVCDGDIAEMILYNSALSVSNRALVNAYIAAKYAITVA